jgi:DNA-binding response OmpR family regulator
LPDALLYTLRGMATNSTLLCIHRDPVQLSLLQENGYALVTATNGCEGLRLFMSQPVDAIVIEYHLGLLDGGVVAAEIKKVKPQLPIIMLSEHGELPDGAWKSVDALVIKSDGPHFLLATVHFVLNVKPAKLHERKLRAQTPSLRRLRGSQPSPASGQPSATQITMDAMNSPFSPGVWRQIRNGTLQF